MIKRPVTDINRVRYYCWQLLLSILIATQLLLITPQSLAASTPTDLVQRGDLLQVSLPGETTLAQPFAVDRQGRIMLPEVGAVFVAGSSISELKTRIASEFANIFLDLTNLRVQIYKKRLIIQVQGYVEQPGEFTLPADVAIQSALHAAGGLRTGAQLDRMQLIRDNSAQVFNYKYYLDSGDSSKLPTLQSMDKLFIPASPMTGNVEVEFDPAKVADAGDAANERQAIKVFGEVNNPGSFSFRQDINIVDLLMRAGGVTRYAGVEQIRVISQGKPQLFNLKTYLDTGNIKQLPSLTAGATIFVPQQEEEVKTGARMVYVMGEVAKPGAYESQQDASFMDILANAGGPTRYAESRQIRIIKASGQVVAFDLSGYTEGTVIGKPPKIDPGDAIFVPEKTDMNEKSWLKVAPGRAVRVLGAVVRPGRIEWSDEMTLLDLLAHVGGPMPRADTNNIEIVTPLADGNTQVYNFDLNAFVKQGHGDQALPRIKAGSTVLVHELPIDPHDNKSQWVRQASDKSIYIFGQVGAPGRYMFTDEMHFLDLLAAADGPTEEADLHNIRIIHRDDPSKGVSKLNLALYFETGDDSLLPQITMGDSIYIPEKDRLWLDQSKETTVRILGAVNKPGRYRFDNAMTLLDLLAEAGGTNSEAYIDNITVVNLSCCKDQARSFDLGDFSRTAAFADLPVLRPGDTVYVPYQSESNFEKFRSGLSDVIQIVALGALFGLI